MTADFAIDGKAAKAVPPDELDRVTGTLDFLIETELKLLAANDARQANADTRITALASAAVALPPLTLSLSKAVSTTPLKVVYGLVVAAAIVVVGFRAWSGWRWRGLDRTAPTGEEQPAISTEAPATWRARSEWRAYQRTTAVGRSDPIRARQLALHLWRSRADDSLAIARTKDRMSVAAALVFACALAVSVILVLQGDFGS